MLATWRKRRIKKEKSNKINISEPSIACRCREERAEQIYLDCRRITAPCTGRGDDREKTPVQGRSTDVSKYGFSDSPKCTVI